MIDLKKLLRSIFTFPAHTSALANWCQMWNSSNENLMAFSKDWKITTNKIYFYLSQEVVKTYMCSRWILIFYRIYPQNMELLWTHAWFKTTVLDSEWEQKAYITQFEKLGAPDQCNGQQVIHCGGVLIADVAVFLVLHWSIQHRFSCRLSKSTVPYIMSRKPHPLKFGNETKMTLHKYGIYYNIVSYSQWPPQLAGEVMLLHEVLLGQTN